MSAAGVTVATTLRTSVNIACQSVGTDGIGNTAPYNINTNTDSDQSFTDGSSNNALNVHRVHASRITLTPSSGTYDVDLTTILDMFGNACNFTRIKAIYVKNRSAWQGGQMLVGPGPSNGWSSPWDNSGTPSTVKETVESGSGEMFKKNPYNGFVVNSTKKNLRFTHNGGSSGSIVFDLIVVGY